jgi:hypothetical protein
MSPFIEPKDFHKLQCYYALKIEVNTGLRHSRGSILKMIQTKYGVKARTKKAALAEFGAMLQDEGVLHSIKA